MVLPVVTNKHQHLKLISSSFLDLCVIPTISARLRFPYCHAPHLYVPFTYADVTAVFRYLTRAREWQRRVWNAVGRHRNKNDEKDMFQSFNNKKRRVKCVGKWRVYTFSLVSFTSPFHQTNCIQRKKRTIQARINKTLLKMKLS